MPALKITPVTPSAIRPTTDICRTILMRLMVLRNAGDRIEAATTMTIKIRNIPYLLKMLESICVPACPVPTLFAVTAGFAIKRSFLCAQTHPGGHLKNLFLGCFRPRKLSSLVTCVHDHDSITHAQDFRQF